MKENSSISDRMKDFYEDRFRISLPRRTNAIIRVDGKAFHSFTKKLKKPVDDGLVEDMNLTAKYLCENIQGAKFGYVQSDEISVWLTDYDDIQTDAWFDYNIQKMCSISASFATARFNQLRLLRECAFSPAAESYLKNLSASSVEKIKIAMFDSRVFVIPELEEVVNYFVWRQQDATRNSISMAAQSMFSHKQLQGKNSSQMQDMMMLEKGVNWNEYSVGFKRGRALTKIIERSELVIELEKCREDKTNLIKQQQYEKAAMMRDTERNLMLQLEKNPDAQIVRKRWEIVEPPIFTQDRQFITNNLKTEK